MTDKYLGKATLFLGVETSNWSLTQFQQAAQKARSFGFTSLIIKIADGTNMWYANAGGWKKVLDTVKNAGIKSIPYTYCYGDKFGGLRGEITILTAAMIYCGVVIADMEAEFNNQPNWCLSIDKALRPVTGEFGVTTWADPQQQEWTQDLTNIASCVNFFLPQVYSDNLANVYHRQFDPYNVAYYPVLNLGQEFGSNNLVQIARTANSPTIGFWEYQRLDEYHTSIGEIIHMARAEKGTNSTNKGSEATQNDKSESNNESGADVSTDVNADENADMNANDDSESGSESAPTYQAPSNPQSIYPQDPGVRPPGHIENATYPVPPSVPYHYYMLGEQSGLFEHEQQGKDDVWVSRSNGVALRGAHLNYFRWNGGVAQFGLPLSDEIQLDEKEHPEVTAVVYEKGVNFFDPYYILHKPVVERSQPEKRVYRANIHKDAGKDLLSSADLHIPDEEEREQEEETDAVSQAALQNRPVNIDSIQEGANTMSPEEEKAQKERDDQQAQLQQQQDMILQQQTQTHEIPAQELPREVQPTQDQQGVKTSRLKERILDGTDVEDPAINSTQVKNEAIAQQLNPSEIREQEQKRAQREEEKRQEDENNNSKEDKRAQSEVTDARE